MILLELLDFKHQNWIDRLYKMVKNGFEAAFQRRRSSGVEFLSESASKLSYFVSPVSEDKHFHFMCFYKKGALVNVSGRSQTKPPLPPLEPDQVGTSKLDSQIDYSSCSCCEQSD